MMAADNLLVELFVEELPPKALKSLGEAFADRIVNGLRAARLIVPGAVVERRIFASPRRLGVWIPDVLDAAESSSVAQDLVPSKVGLDSSGNPTEALLKRLAKAGLGPEVVKDIKRRTDGKDEKLYIDIVVPGLTIAAALQQSLADALSKLPIPKVMTYQLADGWTSVNFVRPAHGLVALHGAEVIPVSVLGLASGRETAGHRFEAKLNPVIVRDADSYEAQIKTEGSVIPSFLERREMISEQLVLAAQKAGAGLTPVDDDALLDEVTALVERPNVLVGQFEEAFLDVPQECLILTMKANQKYFPLLDATGKLTNKFLIVSNIRPADTRAVVGGNERVVRPRLADAKFFFDQDRKKTLESRLPGLARVVYHNKLGTQGERAERVRAIGHAIVNQMRMETVPYTALAKDEFDVLDSKVQEAARLAKADLLTDMVGEFPELQGIMGGYYARHEGLRDGVAIAIEDHYKPRFAGDALPRNHTGTVVALADKLETLCGLFGIGQLPTGDRDPFALRRHALGVIRILIEKGLGLGLTRLVEAGFAAFPPGLLDAGAAGKLAEFVFDRLANQLREQGFSAQQVDAVLALHPERLREVPRLIEAVRAFAGMPEAVSLASANKRVGNILKKVEGGVAASVNAELLAEPAEAALHAALLQVKPLADQAFEAGDYTGSLKALAALKAPVDEFFDKVMVNAEDARLRTNRQGLLAMLHATMNRAADLSRLAA